MFSLELHGNGLESLWGTFIPTVSDPHFQVLISCVSREKDTEVSQ